MTALDVDARLDALYAGPLEEFVTARDALARDVAESGDRVGAARVRRLRRPTVAGWVVNQVVRAHPDDVAALVALGDELRAATADRDRGRIKALDHLRRQRTEALVRPVRAAGQLGGRPVSADALDRLTETLTAVVMDADAAAVVQAGRLEQALQHVGFGIVDEGGEEADVARLRAAAPQPDGTRGEEPAASSSPGAVRGDTVAGTEERAREDEARDGDEARRDALRAVEREVEVTAAEVDRLEALRDAAAARARAGHEAAGREAARAERLGAQAEHLAAELGRLTAERDAARAAAEEARRAEESARTEIAALDAQLDEAEQRAAAARRARRSASARD